MLPDLPAQRRAEPPVTVRRVRRQAPSVRPAEAAALAAKLLPAPAEHRRPARSGAAGSAGAIASAPPRPAGRRRGPRWSTRWRTSTPVRIVYVDGDGRRTDRLIEPLEVEDDHLLLAYCHLRDDDRAFALSRIRASPALTSSGHVRVAVVGRRARTSP